MKVNKVFMAYAVWGGFKPYFYSNSQKADNGYEVRSAIVIEHKNTSSFNSDWKSIPAKVIK